MISPVDLIFSGKTVRGFWIDDWFRRTDPADVAGVLGELATLVADGRLHAPVEATYPLTAVGTALDHAARSHRQGKVLLTGPAYPPS